MTESKKYSNYERTEDMYDWNKARRIYYRENDILPNTMVQCGNPDCRKKIKGRASRMQLHHLMQRRVSPSLSYSASNMILICRSCHDMIHEGWKAYWTLKKKGYRH